MYIVNDIPGVFSVTLNVFGYSTENMNSEWFFCFYPVEKILDIGKKEFLAVSSF